jgi:hypothetical protein
MSIEPGGRGYPAAAERRRDRAETETEMPSLIVFGSPARAAAGDETPTRDSLRVTEEPPAVVNKLGNSEGGFAQLSLAHNPDENVWVNRDQVRRVRGVTA